MAKKRPAKQQEQHVDAPQRFKTTMTRILKVSKSELDRREAEYKKARRARRERAERAIRDALNS